MNKVKVKMDINDLLKILDEEMEYAKQNGLPEEEIDEMFCMKSVLLLAKEVNAGPEVDLSFEIGDGDDDE